MDCALAVIASRHACFLPMQLPLLILVPAGCRAALDAPPFTSGPYKIDEVACHLGECPKYCCTPWHIQPKSVSTNCRRYHRHKHVFWKDAEWSYASDPPSD